MKKNLFLNVFTVLLLLSTSFGGSSANAADPGDGLQFCFLAKNVDGKQRLEFRQKTDSEPTATGEECYDFWSGDGSGTDAYTFISTWLSKPENADADIYVTSSIEFAGYDAVSHDCVDGKNAFKGKMLNLGDKVSLYGSSTPNVTISGLCNNSSDEFTGFVRGGANLQNIDFDGVYFKSTNGGSRVGIIAKNEQTAKHVYQNIHVKNSEFYGNYVGAVLGEGYAYISDISLTGIVIHGGNYAGGIAGYFVAKVSDAASDNDVYSQFNIQSLKIDAMNSTTHYFGGIAGYMMQNSKRKITQCSLMDLNIQGGTYAGGLFGQVEYQSTNVDDSKYSDIYIGKTGTDESVINGSMNAGGLVGYINEGYVTGSAITVTKAGVNANVNGGGASNSTVGGLIGFIQYSSTEALKLTIEHNYVIGDVSGVGDDKNIGYLVGYIPSNVIDFSENIDGDYASSVRFNYHYGPYDATKHSAKIGIGPFDIGGKTGIYETNWINSTYDEKSVNIKYNFRNAVESSSGNYLLSPDGAFGYDYSNTITTSVYVYLNGVIESADMKTPGFASFMNKDEAVWTQKDGVNNDLPFLTGNGAVVSKPIYPVAFNLTAFYNKADAAHQKILSDAISDGKLNCEESDYYKGSSDKALLLFTNSEGKLDGDEVAIMKSLLQKGTSWDGSPALSVDQVYSNGNTFYTYVTQIFNIVNHFCLDDGSGACGSDEEIQEKDGVASLKDYTFGYLLAPVKEYKVGEAGVFVPPLMISKESKESIILPTAYMIESKNSAVSDKTGEIPGGLKKFDDLPSEIEKLDYENDYKPTIHLYYFDATNPETVDINNDNADISIAVNGFGYDGDGKWSKLFYHNMIAANGTVNMPLARGYTVEFSKVGYQFDGWMVEFGKTSEFTSSSVVHASEKYLMKPTEFTSHYNDRVWVLQNLSASDTVYMDSVYKGLSSLTTGESSNDFMMRISPSVTPIDYEVTFDFESAMAGNPLIVFGDSWASSLKKTVNLSESERVFPKSYIYSTSESKFYPMLWSHQTRDKFNFAETPISTVAFKELTPKLLKNALGSNTNVVGFTLYPINPNGDADFGEYAPAQVDIYAYDDDGNKLTAADDYHGSIVLSQTVGNMTVQQKSSLFNLSSDYRHVLYWPSTTCDDTLTFDVSFEPEPGYTIVINKYSNTWTTAPAGEFWGYDADTKKLRISTKNMDIPSFEIQYKPNEHYNIEYTIPESMRNKDIFVANKKTATGKFETDWFTKQENVTIETVKAPPLYNSGGCRINWKPENESKKALAIKDELLRLISIENQSGYVNTLVPDIDHPDCPVGAVTQTKQIVELSRSGDGELTFMQRLSYEPQVPGDPDFIEIKHSFKKDASGNLYIELPRVYDGDGNDLGVKLSMEAVANDGYIFDVLSYKVGTTSEVLLNGSEFDFMNGLNMAVDFVELKPVYVTFDLSLKTSEDSSKTYLPVGSFATGSLKMEKEKDIVEFWKPFRTDKCFSGWSTVKADAFKTGDPIFPALDATNYIDFSKDEKSPTSLYAIWSDCAGAAPTPTIVLKNGNEHTNLVLYQDFGSKSLRHEIPDAGISLAGNAFDFYIDESKTVVEAGYSVDFATYTLSYTYATSSGTSNPKDVASVAGAWRVSTEGIPAVPTYTFNSTASLVEYTVVFNENAAGINAKPFFGDSWATYMTKDAFAVDADKNWTVKANYNIESHVKKFPMALYRNGYCMQGYTFDKNDDANGVYNEMNDLFMDKVKMLGKNPVNSIMLYAYWNVCNDGLTVKLEDTDKGTYKFTRTFDLGDGKKTPERIYEASTATIVIPSINEDISVTGMSFVAKNGAGVIVDNQSNFSYRKKSETKWNEISGNFFSVKADIESIKAPLLKNTYEFIYDLNAPQNVAVFVSPTWKKSESYTLGDVSESKDLQSLNVMGRTDACLVGWALDAKGDNELLSYDIAAIRKLDALVNAGQSVKTLYAVWKSKGGDCKPETFNVVSGMTAEQGSFKVIYSFENKIYEFDVGKDGVEFPVIEGAEIAVKFNGTKAYKFGKNVTGVDANGDVSFDIENGKTFTVGHNQKNITLKVEAEPVEFHLVFDVASVDSVFYGSDWTGKGKYTSIEKNAISFPTMIYDSDRCLAGWSVNSESGAAWTELNEDLLNALYAAYPDFESASDIKLFARWTDKVENCAGNITRVTAEMKYGEVQLVEEIGKSKVVHKFNKKGTMLLPAEIESDNWTLRVSPDKGYKLDSLVVQRDGKKVAVLHDGDHLPKNMKNVVFKGYFVKSNDSPIKIVEKTFDKSGNAIRLIYKTSEFDATRNVFAKVKIVDVAEKKTPVIDTTLSKTVAPSSSNEVIFFVMHPGTFKMLFSIGDGEGSDEISEEFTIDSQIATLKANQWTMVSLAAVDTSSINWDEGYNFYWWDESGVGDYWQYHSFKRGDEIVGNQGYWFSSWNGGSLVMRENLKDDGKDIVWNLEHKLSGWNLVANPHGWSVDLYSMNESALKDVDEESEVRFYRYDPESGGYAEILEETRYLAPYEAVWAQVSKKTTWKISAEPVFDTASAKREKRIYAYPALESSGKVAAKRALAKASTAERWTLQAVLSDKKGKRDFWNILGVGINPFVADEPPASMGDHVNLSIVEGKRALAKSIRAASDEMEWTVNLSASGSREGFLSFAGIDGVQSFGYRVFVTVDGETTEMHEGKPLPVSLNSSKKTATVRVTKGAPVVAAKQSLIKGLRSMTVGNLLHVSFEASEGLVGERTKVELLDVKGKVVATASARTLAGTNAVTMKQPKMGVYIIRVRVGSQQHSSRILVK